MTNFQKPRWIDSAEKFFKDNHCYAGSSKWIARRCCEVSALYNGRQIKGETVVDVQAVQDGLDAYSVIGTGEQPYKELGITIETSYPYRALINQERKKEEMEDDLTCSQWTIDSIEATQDPGKLEEFRAKYGDKGLPPKNVSAASLGRLGGSVKSEAKSTSSRANGRKGGRPKSTKSIDMGDI